MGSITKFMKAHSKALLARMRTLPVSFDAADVEAACELFRRAGWTQLPYPCPLFYHWHAWSETGAGGFDCMGEELTPMNAASKRLAKEHGDLISAYESLQGEKLWKDVLDYGSPLWAELLGVSPEEWTVIYRGKKMVPRVEPGR